MFIVPRSSTFGDLFWMVKTTPWRCLPVSYQAKRKYYKMDRSYTLIQSKT
jgi:hypothetical protein